MDAAGSSQEEDQNESSDAERLVCPICLCTQYFPVVLPCNHMFCFLCIKGAAISSGCKCPLCRSRFPVDCVSKPKIYESSSCASTLTEELNNEASMVWFYEAREGWWRYDARSNCQLEEAYSKGSRRLELLIAGQIYVIDLANMEQYPKNIPARKRRIKRDLVTSASKGIAGVKFPKVSRARSRPSSEA